MTSSRRVRSAVFAVGTILLAGLAWAQRSQDENPAVVLLIVWMVTGITTLIDPARHAATITALGSVGVYTVVVLYMGTANEMLPAGMMMVGVAAYILAKIVKVAPWTRRGDAPGGDDRGIKPS